MKIEYRLNQDVNVLELTGRFDAYEVPAMNQWLDEHPKAHYVIVNLNGVGFIDSSGLAALVKGLKRCRQNGGELVLSDLQQSVRVIFELTRLDKAFQVFKTEAEALQAMAQRNPLPTESGGEDGHPRP